MEKPLPFNTEPVHTVAYHCRLPDKAISTEPVIPKRITNSQRLIEFRKVFFGRYHRRSLRLSYVFEYQLTPLKQEKFACICPHSPRQSNDDYLGRTEISR